MPLPVHDTLGTMYLAPADFAKKVRAYGCAKAYAALNDDAENSILSELIAMASRQIDAYCESQGFGPEQAFSENHTFDLRTRRVFPNNPPVVELLSFGIRTGPGNLTTFQLTPTNNGPDGSPVSWGAIHYNRQENYLELSSLSVAGNTVSTLISLGLMHAQAEIRYKNSTSLRPNIAAATAWQTAFLLNANNTDNSVGPNVRSITSPEMSVTFETRPKAQANDPAGAMHPMAVQLLAQTNRIAIG